ncbi:hypothetical protein AB5J62_20150 [Amycolatopsis sp. cg5]|uniref:hypothetical protein n=1 Tax=Amycolatopsis sp. cg5 TaxID=3238802 RepID=UPI003523727C
MKLRSTVSLAACFAALTLTAACGTSGSSGSSNTGYQQGTSAGHGGMRMPMPDPNEKPAIHAVRAFDLGTLVVDTQGLTLYRFDKDTASPPKSNCEGNCAQVWIPARANGELDVTGMDKALIGRVTRTDGSDQLTLAGWPLYRYVKDEMPGETGGMGADQVWYPIAPDGKKIATTVDARQANALGF